MSHKWRFFCEQKDFENQVIQLNDSEMHYAFHVLRLKEGDEVEVTDGYGHLGKGEIVTSKKNKVEIQIKENHKKTRPRHHLAINLAMPKPSTLDDIIANLTEIGVSEVNVFLAHKTPVKNTPHYEKLIKHAWSGLRINKSVWLPTIRLFASLEDLCRAVPDSELELLCDESPLHDENHTIHNHIAIALKNSNARKIGVFIGPEASFTPQELEVIQKRPNCRSVLLGDVILRVPNAALMASAITLGHFETLLR